MENKGKIKSLNSILTGLMTAAFAAVMGLLYAYYYDLNDDVLMKDILSGVFTGQPGSHNIQMLYPISLALSLVYRLFGNADCYGIYLLLCQYVSLFIAIRFCAGTLSDLICRRLDDEMPLWEMGLIHVFVAVPLFAMSFALVAGHFVFVQYTFAVAMLCAAAAVLYAGNRRAAAVFLIVLAFLTRSEMTALMLPFVLLIPFFRFFEEDAKERKKEIVTVLVIVLFLAAAKLLNFAGYSSGEWRSFNSFFDSRTQIYDFYQIPDYDENKEFYDSIRIDRSEYELLVNYNFGIDSEIDAEKMAKIADYAGKIKTGEGVLSAALRCFPLYLYRLRSIEMPKSFEYPMTDAPWNIIVLAMYAVTFVLTFIHSKREKGMLFGIWLASWRLTVLFLGRTLLWMYILVRGRDPIRITHSLYLLEITVLVIVSCGMLSRILNDKAAASGRSYDRNFEIMAHFFAGFCLLVFLSVCIRFIPAQAGIIKTELNGRSEYNKAYEALDEYVKSNPDRLYFVDVYTSVSYEDNGYTYSQRMLINPDNSISNTILMGGWASKSPIEREKLSYYGFDGTMEDALTEEEAYVVADKDTDMDWIVRYYGGKGKDVTLSKEEEVAGEFIIWKLSEEK